MVRKGKPKYTVDIEVRGKLCRVQDKRDWSSISQQEEKLTEGKKQIEVLPGE